MSTRNCIVCSEAEYESDCLFGNKKDYYCAYLPIPRVGQTTFPPGRDLLTLSLDLKCKFQLFYSVSSFVSDVKKLLLNESSYQFDVPDQCLNQTYANELLDQDILLLL